MSSTINFLENNLFRRENNLQKKHCFSTMFPLIPFLQESFLTPTPATDHSLHGRSRYQGAKTKQRSLCDDILYWMGELDLLEKMRSILLVLTILEEKKYVSDSHKSLLEKILSSDMPSYSAYFKFLKVIKQSQHNYLPSDTPFIKKQEEDKSFISHAINGLTLTSVCTELLSSLVALERKKPHQEEISPAIATILASAQKAFEEKQLDQNVINALERTAQEQEIFQLMSEECSYRSSSKAYILIRNFFDTVRSRK